MFSQEMMQMMRAASLSGLTSMNLFGSSRVLPYFRVRRLVFYSPFFVSDFQHHVGPFCSHKKLRITTLFTAVKSRLSLDDKKHFSQRVQIAFRNRLLNKLAWKDEMD